MMQNKIYTPDEIEMPTVEPSASQPSTVLDELLAVATELTTFGEGKRISLLRTLVKLLNAESACGKECGGFSVVRKNVPAEKTETKGTSQLIISKGTDLVLTASGTFTTDPNKVSWGTRVANSNAELVREALTTIRSSLSRNTLEIK